ncbi:serine-rich adhesin for platelets-like [Clytia hemisphaerica]|uniref:serine-rich adhesin for platelets-like n=1 Tax=Clytia hemisphaerica TaxID=252671 RepID=UPI0034D508D9
MNSEKDVSTPVMKTMDAIHDGESIAVEANDVQIDLRDSTMNEALQLSVGAEIKILVQEICDKAAELTLESSASSVTELESSMSNGGDDNNNTECDSSAGESKEQLTTASSSILQTAREKKQKKKQKKRRKSGSAKGKASTSGKDTDIKSDSEKVLFNCSDTKDQTAAAKERIVTPKENTVIGEVVKNDQDSSTVNSPSEPAKEVIKTSFKRRKNMRQTCVNLADLKAAHRLMDESDTTNQAQTTTCYEVKSSTPVVHFEKLHSDKQKLGDGSILVNKIDGKEHELTKTFDMKADTMRFDIQDQIMKLKETATETVTKKSFDHRKYRRQTCVNLTDLKAAFSLNHVNVKDAAVVQVQAPLIKTEITITSHNNSEEAIPDILCCFAQKISHEVISVSIENFVKKTKTIPLSIVNQPVDSTQIKDTETRKTLSTKPFVPNTIPIERVTSAEIANDCNENIAKTNDGVVVKDMSKSGAPGEMVEMLSGGSAQVNNTEEGFSKHWAVLDVNHKPKDTTTTTTQQQQFKSSRNTFKRAQDLAAMSKSIFNILPAENPDDAREESLPSTSFSPTIEIDVRQLEDENKLLKEELKQMKKHVEDIVKLSDERYNIIKRQDKAVEWQGNQIHAMRLTIKQLKTKNKNPGRFKRFWNHLTSPSKWCGSKTTSESYPNNEASSTLRG